MCGFDARPAPRPAPSRASAPGAARPSGPRRPDDRPRPTPTGRPGARPASGRSRGQVLERGVLEVEDVARARWRWRSSGRTASPSAVVMRKFWSRSLGQRRRAGRRRRTRRAANGFGRRRRRTAGRAARLRPWWVSHVTIASRIDATRGMSEPTRILLTGGGTAGHVNPALAIGRALAGEGDAVPVRRRARPCRGRGRAARGHPDPVRARVGLPGRAPVARAAALRSSTSRVGVVQAGVILLTFRPDVIVGTGGFASAPVMFAAALLRRAAPRARQHLRARAERDAREAEPGGRPAGRPRLRHLPRDAAELPVATACVTGYPLRRRIAAVEPRRGARAARLRDSGRAPGRVRVRRIAGGPDDQPRDRRCARATCCRCADRLFIVHGTGLFKKGGYDAAKRHRGAAGARYTEEERRRIATFYVSRPFFYQIETRLRAGRPRRGARRGRKPLRAGVARPAGHRHPEGEPARAITR